MRARRKASIRPGGRNMLAGLTGQMKTHTTWLKVPKILPGPD